jgi:hypothetical protein
MSETKEKLAALLVVPGTAKVEDARDDQGKVTVRFEFDFGLYQLQAKTQIPDHTMPSPDLASGRAGRKLALEARDGKIVPTAIALFGEWFELEIV